MSVDPRPVACLPAEPQPSLTTEGALWLKRQLTGHVLAATTKSSSGFAGDGIQQRRKRAAVADRVLTVPLVARRSLVQTLGARRDVPNALTAGVAVRILHIEGNTERVVVTCEPTVPISRLSRPTVLPHTATTRALRRVEFRRLTRRLPPRLVELPSDGRILEDVPVVVELRDGGP